MVKVIRASKDAHQVKKVFTLGDFLILLHWIKELDGLEISLSKVPNGGTQLVVGDYAYPIEDIFPGIDLHE